MSKIEALSFSWASCAAYHGGCSAFAACVLDKRRDPIKIVRPIHLKHVHQMVFEDGGKIGDGIHAKIPYFSKRLCGRFRIFLRLHVVCVDWKIKGNAAVAVILEREPFF